jgi:succinoglycan biosynthesis transport protein ExoP
MRASHEQVPSTTVLSLPGASPPVVDVEFDDAPSRHLRDYLRVVYKYRWLAATCCALTVGLVGLVTLLTPRSYTAATRLQVARQSPIQLRLQENVLAVDDGDHGGNGASSFLATQVAVLKSRDLAERAIRTHGLADKAAFMYPGPGRRGLAEVGGTLLAVLRPRGLELPAPAAESWSGAGTPVDPALIERYQRYLEVENVRGTDLIEVRFTTPSPSLSAFLAAAHAQAYLAANQEARRATDATAKEFLGRQLRELREKVEVAEAALARFAAKHPNVAINQEQKTVVQRIAEVSTLLTRAEGTRLTLKSRYEFVARSDAAALAYFLDRGSIQKINAALVDIRASRATLGRHLGSNHPQMVDLRAQEADLERQLAAAVGQEVDAVRARYEAAVLREEQLGRKLAQQEDQAAELREVGARYDLLKNDVENARALHQSLLKQQLETAVNSELVTTNVQVVERAEVPTTPSQPNVPGSLTLALLLGLATGAGVAFLCEYFDSSVKSREEVEGLLQLPALATVPNFSLARRSNRAIAGNGIHTNGRRGDLVVLHEPRSPAAEAFRSLRTAVLFSAAGAPPKVILVTSAGASEGKTVSALNLATSLGQANARVLLLDADLRRPGCHHLLGLSNECGVSNFLAGQVELASIVHALDSPPVAFVSAGPAPPNPAELVGSARMREELERLRDSYDFIIIDSPPVLPVTDAVVLAREVDGVLLVVKGHDTPRELVRRARDQLLQANVHILGAIVNNVDMGWGDLYLYNRYYGRYYGHAMAEGSA